MDSRGIRLGIAIGTTTLLISLNAAAVLTGYADQTYARLLDFRGDNGTHEVSLRPLRTRYASRSVCAGIGDNGSGPYLRASRDRRGATADYLSLNMAATQCFTQPRG